MFDVQFYEKTDGTRPAEEFLDSLDVKMRAKMLGTLLILQKIGNMLREPHSKPLEDGIFEVRAKVGSDITRVLYFFCVGKKIILANGFVKKQSKTPRPVIDLAKKYRADYMERYGEKQ